MTVGSLPMNLTLRTAGWYSLSVIVTLNYKSFSKNATTLNTIYLLTVDNDKHLRANLTFTHLL